jgi:adenine C2-methylase RlmN of 23S rRNA A2503 and tRNA A37
MGCSFCATGTMGEIGNLLCGEIVEQLLHARKFSEIRNVVFMGLGEPFNNYEEVRKSILIISHPSLFSIAPKHITVSTVGIVPKIYTFINDLPLVHLAVSLHAPNQSLRASIVPAAKVWPINMLMEAIDEYIRKTRRRIFIEYVFLKGINDSEEHAHQLGQLLRLRSSNVTLNCIPYNSTSVARKFHSPSFSSTQKFVKVVKSYGVLVTLRKEMGVDISGACGQLVTELKDVEDLITSPYYLLLLKY